jgi:Condensation domain
MNDIDKPRPVGSDQAFWWLIDQNHPVHVAVVAQVAGSTTVHAWRAAFDEIQRRHPNLAGHIRKHGDGDLWFHRVPDAPIPLRVVESDPTAWEPELAKELTTRIDLARAPLSRAALIHQPNLSTVILSMHHSIADAKSIVFAIRDVLRVLSGQSIEPLPPIPSLSRLIFHGSMVAPTDAIEPEPTAPNPKQPDIFRSFDGEMPRITQRTLTPRLTAALLRQCRSEGTTVHGALVTATLTAGRQLSEKLRQAPITVISPSDMRALLEAGEDVAPLAGGAALTMEPDLEPPLFWDTARRVKRDLVPPKTIGELSRAFVDMERFMAKRPGLDEAMAMLAGHGGEKISVNNLGAPSIGPKFGDLTLSAMWGPALLLGYEGERLISAITINGALNLLHVSYNPIPSVLDAIERQLATVCEP